MTDGQMVRAVARIHRFIDQIQDLLDEEILNHPNGEALRGELIDNGLGYRLDCVSIAFSHLMYPERWEIANGTLRRKMKREAAKAAEGGGESHGKP